MARVVIPETLGEGWVPANAEQGPYYLYKSTFIRRVTNEEASTMRGVLNAATDKLQMLYDAVEYFVSDDLLFNELMAATSHALGASRASELLKEE